MKRIALTLAVAIMSLTSAQAQLNLGKLLGGVKDAVSEAVEGTQEESKAESAAKNAAEDVVSDLLKNVLGISIAEEKIPGTWSYVQPAVEFESADALTNAGGSVVAATVEEKIAPMFTKLGIKAGAVVFVMGDDGSLTISVGKKEVKGKWEYDKQSERVTLSLNGNKATSFSTRMTVRGEDMNILFKADKLLEVIKTIASSSSNTTLATIGTLVKAYDGMNIGFQMSRVE